MTSLRLRALSAAACVYFRLWSRTRISFSLQEYIIVEKLAGFQETRFSDDSRQPYGLDCVVDVLIALSAAALVYGFALGCLYTVFFFFCGKFKNRTRETE